MTFFSNPLFDVGAILIALGFLCSLFGDVRYGSIALLGVALVMLAMVLFPAPQPVNIVYINKSGAVSTLKENVTPDSCQQYAENYLRGLTGSVHCVDVEDGKTVWVSPSKN